MHKLSLTLRLASFATLSAVLLFAGNVSAQADAPRNDTVLHVFSEGGSDGYLPAGGVVFDRAGNLYGATTYGGSGGSNCIGGSCGTVYQLAPPAQPGGIWAESILYNFTGVGNQQDGELPNGGLVIDSAGNLYGVTAYGGAGGCVLFGGVAGCGIVFELSPPSAPGGAWTKSTIYSFRGGADGQLPNGSLTLDKAGNLYGATTYGGGFASCNAPYYQYCGTIFELSPPSNAGGTWMEKVLYSFKSGADGANPNGGLIFDKQGAIYGTTYFGGNNSSTVTPACKAASGEGCGTIFRLGPSLGKAGGSSETVLYRFRGGYSDGAAPAAGLAIDEEGDFYGTTVGGGNPGWGTMFRLSRPPKPGTDWAEEVILNFGGLVGWQPMAAILIKDNSLYGTASGAGEYKAGTAFQLRPPVSPNGAWDYTLLCNFPTGNQAAEPESQLAVDSSGALYGTTVFYDTNISGTVFRIGK